MIYCITFATVFLLQRESSPPPPLPPTLYLYVARSLFSLLLYPTFHPIPTGRVKYCPGEISGFLFFIDLQDILVFSEYVQIWIPVPVALREIRDGELW